MGDPRLERVVALRTGMGRRRTLDVAGATRRARCRCAAHVAGGCALESHADRPATGDERRRRAPRAVTYPYRRIAHVDGTPSDGPDPYGDPDPAWLKIDWRQHLRTIDVDGARINCAEIGEGPAIIFVHGLGGCWQNWLENMPRMAELGYRAIAFDLPGFGSSPMPPWDISIPGYGELLNALRETLGVANCTLVGNAT